MLILLGIAGAVTFATAFAASFANPAFVEMQARALIRAEVEKRVRERVASLDNEFLARMASRALKGHAEEAAALQKKLLEGLPQRLAATIAEMQDLDCECRRKVETKIRDVVENRIGVVTLASGRLTALIRARYMETATQLTREFRIFTGSNAAVFCLLAIAALVKRRAGVHLIPPALVLVGAAGMTAYLYLFQQDWLHTIVFGDYVGLWYLAYLSVAFSFLADIVFNRARVTTEVLNALFEAIGSAFTVAPC